MSPSFDAPLSKKIQKEYNKLVEVLSRVPPNLRAVKEIEGTGGLVSVNDIIAYQIGWGRLLIGWYETGIKGEMPDMPGEGFSSWDYVGLAKHFYKKYQNESQTQQFHHVVSKILDIVETEHKTGNLDKTGIWPWCTLLSGKEWPLSKWVTVNTASPYKKASTLIKKFSLKPNKTVFVVTVQPPN